MAPRLLLIYPATHKLGWVRYFQLPSHSLQQVAAAIPPPWEITFVDELHDRIPFGTAFDLIGIAPGSNTQRGYEMADRFRAEEVPVIMGGIHPTVHPEEALTHADAVVIGEAEPVMGSPGSFPGRPACPCLSGADPRRWPARRPLAAPGDPGRQAVPDDPDGPGQPGISLRLPVLHRHPLFRQPLPVSRPCGHPRRNPLFPA